MSGTMSPNGTIALQGGGPFDANDDLDRRLLAAAGAQQVLVLPTADAFERPERLVAAAMNWGERLGVEVEALMVMWAVVHWMSMAFSAVTVMPPAGPP